MLAAMPTERDKMRARECRISPWTLNGQICEFAFTTHETQMTVGPKSHLARAPGSGQRRSLSVRNSTSWWHLFSPVTPVLLSDLSIHIRPKLTVSTSTEIRKRANFCKPFRPTSLHRFRCPAKDVGASPHSERLVQRDEENSNGPPALRADSLARCGKILATVELFERQTTWAIFACYSLFSAISVTQVSRQRRWLMIEDFRSSDKRDRPLSAV